MPIAEASKSVGADGIRPKKIAILVAGMHRSGTSAVVRILNLLGCDLPCTLMGPTPFNEKGHWESQPFMDLNDEILSSAGSSWDDWRAFDAGWYASPVAGKFREQAQILLKEEYGDSLLFVLKDPRICRLLEFWKEEIEKFGAEVRVVSPIRNPLDVASSLETRDGIAPSIGHLLWLRHVLHAEVASRHIKRAYLRYETLLTEVQAVTDVLEKNLEVSWPKRNAVSSDIEIDEFLSTRLRHHRTDDTALLRNPKFSHWIRESFDLFDRWSRAEVHVTDTKTLDQIRMAFDEATPAFSRAIAVGVKAAKGLSAAAARTLKEREEQVETLSQTIAEHRKQIDDLRQIVADRDERIKAAQETLKEREEQVETLSQTIAEHRKQIDDLRQIVADRDERIKAAQETLKEREEQVATLNQAVTDRDRWMVDLRLSNSWRMTAPLRKARRASFAVFRKSRSLVSQTVRTLYRRIPLPFKVKLRLKDRLFRLLPFLFRHTWVYRTWKTVDQDAPTSTSARLYSSQTEGQGDHAVNQYVARSLDEIGPETLAVRLIAFYLPQFHPIRENDEWWGKGFTEWTNVAKAQPNFDGHYQPRLPADLGFYDLRVPEVMEHQAELARQYGIYGFCYHYYWFGGKRLLEMPLERMLRTGKPDFPFCLSWANENWTRKWDGLEHEILIEQQHSDEDDTAVIHDLIRYFRHPNYIRVNGKPLFLVYRVGLLPNVQRTVQRWRDVCRKEKIGDIYLGMVGSFEHGAQDVNPEIYGFDAIVEFPPHYISAPMDVPSQLLNSNYVGKINDYRKVVEQYQEMEMPPYPKFRGVMPDWDNTARRWSNSTIFHHANPAAYQSWLRYMIRQTCENYSEDERLVFINAWNEWGEGAYLEPDQKYGYAYLQATRNAIQQAASVGRDPSPTVSVIVPNYNHERFLKRRLESIYSQSFKGFEVIILDDASTDASIEIIAQYQQRFRNKTKVIRNQENSGNVFSQWLAGLDLAQGDLVWIAESDDTANLDFLERMVDAFHDASVLLAYADIQYINSNGQVVPGISSYLAGTGSKWDVSYKNSAWREFDGPFGVVNIIANVSGAVFRRPELSESERDTLTKFRVCGDWYFYSIIARGGRIAFVKEAKSFFRLRSDSVSRRAYAEEWFYQEHYAVLQEIQNIYDISWTTIQQHFHHLNKLFSRYRDMAGSRLQEIFPRHKLFSRPEEGSLRICIASIGFYLGGGEIVPIDLANALRSAGHSGTFFSLDWEGGETNDVIRRRLRNDIPICHKDELRSSFQCLHQEFGFQIINTHNILVDLFMHNESYKPLAPWVVTQHGSYETSIQCLNKEFLDYIKDSVDHWTVVANKNKDPLTSRGIPPSNFTQISNGVPQARQVSYDQRSTVRQTLDIPLDAFVFVIASRAIPEKGWEYAVQALESARKRTNIDLHLLLIGDGPEAHRLREAFRGKRHIHILGLQSDVSRFIVASDAGIFPSFYAGESFPVFVAECLVYETPVIVSDIGECRKMLSNRTGETAGVIVESRTSNIRFRDDLANAVLRLTTDHAMYRKARSVATEISPNFSMERIILRYIDLFNQLL